MPYLDRPWMINDVELERGTWVPERNQERWDRRAFDIGPDQLPWRREQLPANPPSGTRPRLSATELAVLAADMVSAQRDAFIYANLFERLKDSPDDETADGVVEQMRTLGFASADWPAAVGGPPPRQSPRPFRKVLDWLLKLAAQVTRFLLNAAEYVMTSLPDVVSAVAVEVSVAPGVSLEFPTSLINRPVDWQRARVFLDAKIAELSAGMFA